ncbi:MAG: hypothetical protein IJJ26_05665 [Victivallales bacterium]|nr:hypothetical protein [Victivallales bacterium]
MRQSLLATLLLFSLPLLAGPILLDFNDFSSAQVKLNKKASWEVKDGKFFLTIPEQRLEGFPGVILTQKDGKPFDVTGYQSITLDIKNLLDTYSGSVEFELILKGNYTNQDQWECRCSGGCGYPDLVNASRDIASQRYQLRETLK